MGKCNSNFILDDCMCLTDPFDVYSTVCGYISKLDGQMYPCDSGCCVPSCKNTNQIVSRLEAFPKLASFLPMDTTLPVQAPVAPTPVAPTSVAPTSFPYWTLLVMFMFLALVFLGLKIPSS